jgi:hypothetical protein
MSLPNGCPDCSRLRDLFSTAIYNYAELRNQDIAALTAGDMAAAKVLESELDRSTAEIETLRIHLLDHGAAHVEEKPATHNQRTTVCFAQLSGF